MIYKIKLDRLKKKIKKIREILLIFYTKVYIIYYI